MDQRKHTALTVLDRIGAPVLAVGSLNADMVVSTEHLPRPGETVPGGDLRILPGGKSANQAAASALLGAETRIIGALGRDANAELVLHSLADKGVDTQLIGRRDVPTGTAVITVDAHAENTIVVSPGANAQVTPDDLHAHREAFERARCVGLCFEIPYKTVVAAAQMAHDAHATCVLNVSPVRTVPAELMELVDVLIVNEHETAIVCGKEVDPHDHAALAAHLGTAGARRAVVTLGAAGSVVVDNGTVSAIDPFPVKAVDTTGAGDSFMGALMAGLSGGASLTDAATLASAVSAFATLRVGAQSSYPSAIEVRGFLDTLG